MTDRPLLPHDLDAERALIGSMLLAGDEVESRRGLMCSIAPGDFLAPDHVLLFRALIEMDRQDAVIDAITLRAHLKARGDWDADTDVLLRDVINSVPSHTNGPHYARIVRDLAQQRMAIMVAESLQQTLYRAPDPASAAEAIDQATERLQQITQRDASVGDLLMTDMGFIIDPEPEPDFVISEIFRLGEMAILNAPSKSSKSMLILQACIAVATGTPFLEEFATVRRRVVYINYELKRSTLGFRCNQICRTRNIDPRLLQGWLEVYHLKGVVGKDLFAMADAIERSQRNYELIVFDPLRNAYPATLFGEPFNENASTHLQAVASRGIRLAEKTGAAVVIVHHTPKAAGGARSNVDAGAGSGALAGAADGIYSLVPHELERCFVLRSDVRSFKSLPPTVIEARWPIHLIRHDLNADDVARARKRTPLKENPVAPKPEPWTPERIANLATGWMVRETIVTLAMTAGAGIKEAERLIKVAIDTGLLEGKLPDGRRKTSTHFRRAKS